MPEKKSIHSSNSAPSVHSLSKVYEPKDVEGRWYAMWEKKGFFDPPEKGPSFTIVIPPPNVTGSLHMGHALNSTLQDVLTRYHKLKGEASLWVPGTDHGGIATQNVVEKILKKEGVSRHTLGREKFLERMWNWRKETGDTILSQLKRLGASLDWKRNRFTMDEVCSKAVRTAFIEFFNKGLLYRGNRLVNWCPRCHTALADIEVEHKDTKGHLWHIRYPLVERRRKKREAKKQSQGQSPYDLGYVIVATTRPETLLGDTAVAVHPKDKRYKELAGGKVQLPLTNRAIPIVKDDAVDKTFGSGAVKVTPAHDPTDFEIAERHKLPHITVIGFEGKMTKAAGVGYDGMDRFEARKKVVEDLEYQGLLEKVEDYNLSVSVCYRCDSVIEPLESEQWFLSVTEMAKKAREANKKREVRIVPKSWENPYQLWLRNLKDWCVSRQIWWGHRIPVWYCIKRVGEKTIRTSCPPMAAMEAPKSCAKCKNKDLEQDPDVLDTWFSSALWPFSVFSWPEKTKDLKRFYPTSTLVTGHEILYLWVARMVMFGLYFLKKVPFDTVFIHGIVRDKQGRKMSKSLGNVIDPLDLINEFGADAMRFSLSQSAAPGRDMQISRDSFIGARNFSNKIWNATRFSLTHLKEMKTIPPLKGVMKNLDVSDKWILHEYNQMIVNVTKSMDEFDMDSAAREIYDFFWAEFCDWYLEMIKPRIDPNLSAQFGTKKESGDAARVVLATVLEGCLQLLHPFMPFITEELWQKVPKSSGAASGFIMASHWPRVSKNFENKEAAKKIELLKEIVGKLRSIRSEMGIPTSQRIEVIARTSNDNTKTLLENHQSILRFLNSKVEKLTIDATYSRPKTTAAAVVPGADLYVPLEGLIDFSKERSRLEKELLSIRSDADRLAKKLSNQDFLTHAPKEEVAKAENRLKDSQERAKRLSENIAILSN